MTDHSLAVGEIAVNNGVYCFWNGEDFQPLKGSTIRLTKHFVELHLLEGSEHQVTAVTDPAITRVKPTVKLWGYDYVRFPFEFLEYVR